MQTKVFGASVELRGFLILIPLSTSKKMVTSSAL